MYSVIVQVANNIFSSFFKYALGYGNYRDNRTCRRNVLRLIDNFSPCPNLKNATLRYEIYDFDTYLWTTLYMIPHWRLLSHCGLYLKGNNYWGAAERNELGRVDHIICFDFTRERFGPLLSLPFTACNSLFASLSSVREENIAALFMSSHGKAEIWITTKIDEESVSWSHFFTMYMPYFERKLSCKTFFVDEEKKVVVVFDKEGELIHSTVNITGEDRCLRILELGEAAKKHCWPRMCSYVPSRVQIKKHIGSKRTEVKGKKEAKGDKGVNH